MTASKVDLLYAFKCHSDRHRKINVDHVDNSCCCPLPISFDEQPSVSEDGDKLKLENYILLKLA